jgi:hypothetical protein
MTEEINEIDRLIKQSGELADSLLRLARKLQQRGVDPAQEQPEHLAALENQLTELASRSGEVMHEIDGSRRRQQDKAYVTVRRMVESGTITPQEAAITLLQAAVTNQAMTPAAAAEQLAKLLEPGLPASKKIEIRETAKTAFETGDDVVSKVRPFLRGAQQQRDQEIRRSTHKAEKKHARLPGLTFISSVINEPWMFSSCRPRLCQPVFLWRYLGGNQ